MNQPTVLHDTFVIERTYAADRTRVFAYLADPAKKRRWYAESDHHEIEAFEMDFREGGIERNRYRMGASTPFPGVVLANDGTFEDIVAETRIVMSTSMTLGGRRISTTLITFELFDDPAGAKLVLTHQACFYEGADGPEMRKGGWTQLLDRLSRAVAN